MNIDLSGLSGITVLSGSGGLTIGLSGKLWRRLSGNVRLSGPCGTYRGKLNYRGDDPIGDASYRAYRRIFSYRTYRGIFGYRAIGWKYQSGESAAALTYREEFAIWI